MLRHSFVVSHPLYLIDTFTALIPLPQIKEINVEDG